MKNLIKQLHKNHVGEVQKTPCEEAAKMCFIDIAVNLHELILLGFTPEEINSILDTQLEKGLDTTVINSIVSR